MTLTYNAQGQRKKELIKAIEEINNVKAKYLGVPSCAYQVGEAKVTKQGNVETEDENLSVDLTEYGFTCIEGIEKQIENTPKIETEKTKTNLSISLPDTLDDDAFERLKALVASKKSLIEKALESKTTEIIRKDGKLDFPWFKLGTEEDELFCYILFLTKLIDTAKEQKRVTAKEKETDNDKYAFRCFLLRLGFIGDDYKGARKLLLRNLDGNSAFRSGKAKEV